MTSLKKQKRKLLIEEITSRIMECLLGLNQKNEAAIQKTTMKYSRRMVKAYYGAIKQQHNKIKETIRQEQQPIQPVYEESTNFMAS